MAIDPVIRKRALDRTQDARNRLRLQIQQSGAGDSERREMLQTLDAMWEAAALAGTDGGETVYPTLQTRDGRR